MAKKKKQKKKQGEQNESDLKRTLKGELSARKPVFIFVFGFIGFIALFYVVWMTPFFTKNILEPITELNAYLSSKTLNLLGQKTTSNGSMVNSPLYALEIKRGCDALEPMAFFSAAVLMFPAPWKAKLKGLGFGILFLFVLNVIRIVSLYFVGLRRPDLFEFIHVDVWQVAFIFFGIVLWVAWIKTSTKPLGHAEN